MTAGRLKPELKEAIKKLWQQIGNTPFVTIKYRYRGGPEQSIIAKCEYFNMTGSVKDRMALYIIEKAYEQGRIQPGDQIVEASSGNTGIALANIGWILGHPVKVLMPDWMSPERREIMARLGAEIQLISREQGGIAGGIKMTGAMSFHDQIFLTKQFENLYNVEAHEKTTGREIGYYLLLKRIIPHAFVAGVGTGGTLLGVGKYLRILFPDVQLHALEPMDKLNHRIQGISDEMIPPMIDLSKLGRPVKVEDGDAILLAQRLSKELKLPVGISSGANLLGAIKLQQQMENGSVVVTVLPDNDQRYLSTALFQKEPVREGYLTPDIQFTGCELTERDKHVNY